MSGAATFDEATYRRLVEPHRAELHAHCYRMLGSVHDADDALQDALLRAWRGLSRVQDRGALRSWLYRIATNTCLDLIARRPKRVLPTGVAPAADPHVGPGEPLVESSWVEPYPDVGVEDGYSAPAARYERRESVELAFIAALQHLPTRQRAVLILREVLGFSAREVAETLDTSVPSVNSALQRARAAVEERLPERSQQATLRTLGDARLRELVEGFVEAWDRGDVPAVVALLTDDAALTMPPLRSWFLGRDDIAAFLAQFPLSGLWRWRHVPGHANGQPALGCYAFDPGAGCFVPFALEVLTVREGRIAQIDAFVTREVGADLARWPERPPADPGVVAGGLVRFGLPEALPA